MLGNFGGNNGALSHGVDGPFAFLSCFFHGLPKAEKFHVFLVFFFFLFLMKFYCDTAGAFKFTFSEWGIYALIQIKFARPYNPQKLQEFLLLLKKS